MAKQTLKDVKLEVLVGGVVFLMLLLLAAFTILLTRENIFRKRYAVTVWFSDIGTLVDGEKVVVRGVPVGKVRKLELDEDRILVHCSLDKPIAIHDNYKVRVISTSVLGGNALQIDRGGPPAPLVPPDTILVGTDPVDLLNEASETVAQVRRALDEGGVVSNVQAAAQTLREITDKINQGQGLLARLINDPALGEDFKALAVQVREVAGRIERQEGTLGRLLSSDDTLYTNLAATVASLKTVSGRLENGEGTLGRLLSSDDTLYTNLAATVASLREMAERVERGEGTLGKLMAADDALYHSLTQAVASLQASAEKIDQGQGTLGLLINDPTVYQDIQALLREGKALVEDYRETAPVVSFGSLLMGGL